MAKTIPQLTDATTVNAADELIIQQGGITKRATGAELAKGLNTINGTVNVKDFGAVGDGVADDTAAIQAAIDSMPNGGRVLLNRGTYKLTSTLLFSKSNIILEGSGSDNSRHDFSPQGTFAGTKLVWAGAAGQGMLYIYSPDGALLPKHSSCGARNIFFEAGNAGYGIVIGSQNNGIYENLFFNQFNIAAVLLSTISGLLADARDPQRNRFINVICEQIGATGAGFVLGGDATTHPSGRIANVSYNEFTECDVFISNSDGFVFYNSDMNIFSNCRVIRSSGGSGNSIVFHGADTSAYEARSNTFIKFGTNGNVPILGKGSPTYSVASNNNNVFIVDTTNGTPEPTLETGASIWWSSDKNVVRNAKLSQTTVADSVDLAGAGSLLLGNESFRVHNNSANHMRFSVPNNANEYGFHIEPNANPDLHNFKLAKYFTSGTTIPITISGTGGVVIGSPMFPLLDDAFNLGINGVRWAAVYAVNGTIQSSDERDKTDIEDSPLGLEFINALRPVSYKWINGGNTITETDASGNITGVASRTGERVHFGLLSQQVKSVLPENVDFGGWILTDKDDPESKQGLRYDQFIAPIIKSIQQIDERLTALES